MIEKSLIVDTSNYSGNNDLNDHLAKGWTVKSMCSCHVAMGGGGGYSPTYGKILVIIEREK